MLRVNAASLVESARVGADSLRSNPLRTVLATSGVIITASLAYAGTAVFRRITGAGIFPVVHLSTPLIAIGAAVAVGVVFGTYPVRRAANLSPIDAIAR
jgi:ABC-type antimicrobial peptide transport system permease subunit